MQTPSVPRINGQLTESVRVDLVPELIWPSSKVIDGDRIPYDSRICPYDDEAIQSRDEGYYECCVFWTQVSSTENLLMFDKYLDAYVIKSLAEVVNNDSSLKSIKILCGKRFSVEEEFKSEVDDLRMKARNKSIDFKLKDILTSSFPYPHDRFAVTDGELWHFGATVGGAFMGHTAVSRGWNDEDAKFSRFFYKVFTPRRRGW